MAVRRVVITTFGSLGDLHPYLAIGQELHRRGYAVRVATMALFQPRVEAAGLEFAPLRAVVTEEPTPELMRKVLHRRTGVRYLLQALLMPALRAAYADTEAAADGADLLLAHPLTFATPLVAARRGLPWVSTQLAPAALLSAYDPPVLPGLGWLRRLGAGPRVYRAVLGFAARQTRRWLRPVDALRAELGVPDRGNPLFAGGHSPWGTLALFSRLLEEPQPDWPTRVTVTGFPFYEQDDVPCPALDGWLAEGPAPVIFTLGSSAVMAPGDFYRESVAAAQSLGVRALLVGYVPAGTPANVARTTPQGPHGAVVDGDADVFGVAFASYARVFPRGVAVVHQGGVGTTAEALRAGRPMLVVPFGVDQPDNAERARRLGVARVLSRKGYRAPRVAAELRALLTSANVREKATEIGAEVRAEAGAAVAARALEKVLAHG